jgi:phosphomevalonate kinase
LKLSARRLLNEAGERAAKAKALRAAAGAFNEVVRVAACVNEAIERTAARDELVDEVSILAVAEAFDFLQLGCREAETS